MGTLFKILAISNALAMALPIGWCCPSPAAAAQAEAAAPAACPNCHRASPEEDGVPAAPESPEKCPCCQVRAIAAGQPVPTAPDAEPWTVLPPAVESNAPAAIEHEPARFISPPGPSLQILHCVWRC